MSCSACSRRRGYRDSSKTVPITPPSNNMNQRPSTSAQVQGENLRNRMRYTGR